MKYIVVHGGRAHLDDVMACALAMAHKGPKQGEDQIISGLAYHRGPLPIERRDPTATELADPDVLVLDVGRQLDPVMSNFDHHQLDRIEEDCAMSLLANELRVPFPLTSEAGKEPYYETYGDFLPAVFGWWKTAVLVDQQGPFVAAKRVGLAWKDVSPFMGPLAGAYLKIFEDVPTAEDRGQFVWSTLTRMVDEKVAAWFDIERTLTRTLVGDVEVLDFTRANPETCEDASAAFTAKLEGGVAIFIARPRRDGEDWSNTGLTLMRIADDARIDFRRVKDEPGVVFAHAGGFLCQMQGRSLDEAKRLIALATKGGEA